MMMSPLLFAASFMFFCVLLLLGIINGKIHWMLKALLVVSSLMFCGMAYKGYQNSLGYPVSVDIPETFQLFYGLVHEPNPSRNEKGQIFIWIGQKAQLEPRVIEIPYTKKNRDAVNAAKEKIKNGEDVYMSLKKQKGSMEEEGNGTAGGNSGKGHARNDMPYNVENNVLDFEMPPDTVPKKDDD